MLGVCGVFEDGRCECDGPPSVVIDWAQGDRVCQGCGVVLEGHVLDAASAGGPGLHHQHYYEEHRAPTREGSARDASVREGMRLVDHAVSQFALSTTGTVAATAKELFRDMCDARGVRSDARPARVAATLYHAFRMEGVARELRLVSRACGVEPRALRAASNECKEALVSRPYYARLFTRAPAEAHLDVFLNRMDLVPVDRKRLWRAARRMMERLGDAMDCGRKPRSLCCGVLYLAAGEEGIAASKDDVAAACEVCIQTLDKVVAHLRKAAASRVVT